MLTSKTFLIAVFVVSFIWRQSFILMTYVYQHFACMYICTLYACGSQRTMEPPLWLELNLDPFQEQGVLTSELLDPALFKDGN